LTKSFRVCNFSAHQKSGDGTEKVISSGTRSSFVLPRPISRDIRNLIAADNLERSKLLRTALTLQQDLETQLPEPDRRVPPMFSEIARPKVEIDGGSEKKRAFCQFEKAGAVKAE
jgi:hypothetical protein